MLINNSKYIIKSIGKSGYHRWCFEGNCSHGNGTKNWSQGFKSYIGMLYWYCIGMLYWYAILVCYIGMLYWYVILVCYIGMLYWYVILVCYIGMLYWYVILVCYIGMLYWYCIDSQIQESILYIYKSIQLLYRK